MPQSHKLYFTTANDKVNLFATCEPLIWQGWKTSGREGITRSILRDVLDFMVLRPDLADEIHDCQSFDTRSIGSWRSDLDPLSEKYILDDDAVRSFFTIIFITWVKGLTAVSSLWQAQALHAAFPVTGLTFATGRSLLDRGQLGALKDESLIAGVRLFLDEIQHFPVIESLDDVLRLRSNKDFSQFKSILHQWMTAISSGDISAANSIRSEIRKSNEALRRVIKCEAVGRYFVYVGLPLVVLDAIALPIFSAALSVAGFGVQAYADWQRRKHRWLMIGQS
jgi:hypothetical protein